MFCPTCGKDNALELKFCASCGTNLEAVSHALTGSEDDFFTEMDSGIANLSGGIRSTYLRMRRKRPASVR